MADDVAKLGIEIDSSGAIRAKKNLKSLENQGVKNERSNKRLGESFGGLTTIVGALAGSLVINKFIQTAGSFESMSKSLETVTGSAEKASLAMDGIRQLAQETPFQVSELTQAFIKLKALGIQPTEENLRSFGNTSAAMGKSLNQMIEAVADAATGEFERLKEFGIKARSEGDNVSLTFQGVTTTIGKNSEEITKYLQDIGENQFAGAMINQMDTIQGKTSNLGDAFENLFVTFSEAGAGKGVKGALDVAIDAVNFLTEGVEILPSLFVAAFASVDKYLANVKFSARKIKEETLGIFDVEATTKERRDLLTKEFNEELARIDGAALAFISAEEEKRNAIIETDAITQAGALDPAAAAEKMMEEAAAKAELQNEIWADEFFRTQDKNEHLISLEERAADQRKAIARDEANARRAVMDGMFGNLISLMDSGSKKMFNIGKVAAIASGVINMYESVTSAYAAGAKVGGPVVGAAFAVTAGLAQAANLAKIKSASFGGGGGAATVSSSTGGQPVTGQLQTQPPSQAQEEVAKTRELRVTVDSDGPNSDGMRQFIDNLADTLEDMGSNTRLVLG